MKAAHVVISGEVAGGQVICERIIEALLRRGDEAMVISPNEGAFTERIQKRNVPVFFIPFRKTYHVQSAFRLAALLKKMKVDLLHTHGMVPTNVLSRLAANLSGIPCISHIHIENVFSSNPFIREYQIFLDRLTSKRCFKLIAVSESTKQSLVGEKIKSDHIEVILNGITPERLRPSRTRQDVLRQWSIPGHHRVIGLMGRLCPVKGVEELIEAMALVSKKRPAVSALIVGQDLEFGGDYEQKLKRRAKALGLNGRLAFTGYQSDSASFLNAMDFLVLPSKAEGLPLVILEAMALKKAAIASRVGGVGEVIEEGKTGLLVPPGNVEMLAQQILKLVENPSLAQEMGKLSFERVRTYFSETNMLNRIFELYDEALGKN